MGLVLILFKKNTFICFAKTLCNKAPFTFGPYAAKAKPEKYLTLFLFEKKFMAAYFHFIFTKSIASKPFLNVSAYLPNGSIYKQKRTLSLVLKTKDTVRLNTRAFSFMSKRKNIDQMVYVNKMDIKKTSFFNPFSLYTSLSFVKIKPISKWKQRTCQCFSSSSIYNPFWDLKTPSFLNAQKKSFQSFLNHGLIHELEKIEKITNSDHSLELVLYPKKYRLMAPKWNPKQTLLKRKTYSCALYIPIQFTNYKTQQVISKWFLLCHLPLMTKHGHFVVNGSLKIIMNQIVRSPGVSFQKVLKSNKQIVYSADFIAQRGTWLRLEMDHEKEEIWAKLKRTPKLPVFLFLRCFGVPPELLCHYLNFYAFFPKKQKQLYFKDTVQNLPRFKSSSLITKKHIHELFAMPRRKQVLEKTNLSTFSVNLNKDPKEIEEETNTEIKKIERTGRARRENSLFHFIFSSSSGFLFERFSQNLYQGSPDLPTSQSELEILAKEFLYRKFFNPRLYNLSLLGRRRINQTLGLNTPLNYTLLTPKDVLFACFYLIECQKGFRNPTDIDNLKNRKIRPAGELIQNQFAVGFFRFEKSVRENMILLESGSFLSENQKKFNKKQNTLNSFLPPTFASLSSPTLGSLTEHKNKKTTFSLNPVPFSNQPKTFSSVFKNTRKFDLKKAQEQMDQKKAYFVLNQQAKALLSSSLVQASLREFFGTNPLCQLLDQTNPLAEITHKRRLSSLGFGGISRDTAGMAIRGIHPSHYGRICPIETPEGQNAGLVNSFTIHSRLNPRGIIETPFYKVHKGSILKKHVELFSSDQEKDFILGPGDMNKNRLNTLPVSVSIPCRQQNQFTRLFRNHVDFIGVSSLQMISIATSLIPFVEHDDGNRALMGSNMQRQSVPTLKPSLPIVGTGLESKIIADLHHGLQINKTGFVSYVDGQKIIIYSAHPTSNASNSFWFKTQTTKNITTTLKSYIKLRKYRTFGKKGVFTFSTFRFGFDSNFVFSKPGKTLCNKNFTSLTLDKPFLSEAKVVSKKKLKGPRPVNQSKKNLNLWHLSLKNPETKEATQKVKKQREKIIKANAKRAQIAFKINHCRRTSCIQLKKETKKIEFQRALISKNTISNQTFDSNFHLLFDSVNVNEQRLFDKQSLKKSEQKNKNSFFNSFYKKQNSFILQTDSFFNSKQLFTILNSSFHNDFLLVWQWLKQLSNNMTYTNPNKEQPFLSQTRIKWLKKYYSKSILMLYSKRFLSLPLISTTFVNGNKGLNSRLPSFNTKNFCFLKLNSNDKKEKKHFYFQKAICLSYLLPNTFNVFLCSYYDKLIQNKKHKIRKPINQNYGFLFIKKHALKKGFKSTFINPTLGGKGLSLFLLPKETVASDTKLKPYAPKIDTKFKVPYIDGLTKLTLKKNFIQKKNPFFSNFNTFYSQNKLYDQSLRQSLFCSASDQKQKKQKFVLPSFSGSLLKNHSYLELKQISFYGFSKKSLKDQQKNKKIQPNKIKNPIKTNPENTNYFLFSDLNHTKPKISFSSSFIGSFCLPFRFSKTTKKLNPIFLKKKQFSSLPLGSIWKKVKQIKNEKLDLRCQRVCRKGKSANVFNHSFIPITYPLDSFFRSNQDTYLCHRPIVEEGQWVEKKEIIADNAASKKGQLALGQNLLIAYMPWEGYNFEDAVLMSEQVISNDLFTTLQIERYEIEVKNTKFGNEKITNKLPDANTNTSLLDHKGIIKVGSWVKSGDILVGKITPIEQKILTPHERLLYEILNKENPTTRDTSLKVPLGVKGRVIHVECVQMQRVLISTNIKKRTKKKRKSKTSKTFKTSQTLQTSNLPLKKRKTSFSSSFLIPSSSAFLPSHFRFLGTSNLFSCLFTKKNKIENVGRHPYDQSYLLYPLLAEAKVATKLKPLGATASLKNDKQSLKNLRLMQKLKFKKKCQSKLHGRQHLQIHLNHVKSKLYTPMKDILLFTEKGKKKTIKNQTHEPFLGSLNLLAKSTVDTKLKEQTSEVGNSKLKNGTNKTMYSIQKTVSINTIHRLSLFLLKNKKQVQKKAALFQYTLPGRFSLLNTSKKKEIKIEKKTKHSKKQIQLNLLKSKRDQEFVSQTQKLKTQAKIKNTKISKNTKKKSLLKEKLRTRLVPLKVHVYIAEKRHIQVGDKIAGRHGNKGIISSILPKQDMPYLPDGTPIDLVLNPLGVPSRMNVGQIFECLLGLAGYYLGQNYKIKPFDEIYGSEASRSLVYLKLYEARMKTGQNWLFNPNFPGKTRLFDGRTGECFDQPITVGYAYILKLIHQVDEKIHARSIGPYSLVTQQPLRGRSKRGGQRVGEMEVWAFEGFGAAYILQELLTIKSDDLKGREQVELAILENGPFTFGMPESFKVLVKELQALCLDITISKKE